MVDCLRMSGKMKEAWSLLDRIESRIVEVTPLATINTEQLRGLILVNDRSDVAGNAKPDFQLPSVLIRGINFAAAMARWASTGFKLRSQDEIDERLAICQACPKLQGDTCSVCGCNCNANGVINKLALKGQACPLGKWS